MPNTVAALPTNGIAVASTDYRFATEAVFPAILQDCNRAVSFLYDHADKYGLEKNRMALMEFSAGGHLAPLMGTPQYNKVMEFYVSGICHPFRFKAAVDFYGPIDLVLLPGKEDEKSPEGLLIGVAPLYRPELAKIRQLRHLY